jgi:hypothetical protein
MAGSAGLLYIGIRLEKDSSLGLTYSRGRRTSLYNSGEFEGSSDQAKELC